MTRTLFLYLFVVCLSTLSHPIFAQECSNSSCTDCDGRKTCKQAGCKWPRKGVNANTCIAKPLPCTIDSCDQQQCQKRGKCRKGGCGWIKDDGVEGAGGVCGPPCTSDGDGCLEAQCQKRWPCNKAGCGWNKDDETCGAAPPPCTPDVCDQSQCASKRSCRKGGCAWMKGKDTNETSTCLPRCASDTCGEAQCQRKKFCKGQKETCTWDNELDACSISAP